MKTSSHTPNPAAEEQAALWAARLDGSSLTAADHAALEAWLAEDPSHRALLSSYCQFSTDLEEQLPAMVAAGSLALPETAPRPRARFGWFAGLTLASAAAIAVMLAVWPRSPRLDSPEIATSAAHRQSMTLADGTRIDLNANTRLVVAHTATERRVQLASGEAFFVVSKDPSRPFIVQTPAGSVRVTGTEFNVRSEIAAQLEVTVAEGSVQVRPSTTGQSNNDAAFALTAGHRLTADANGVKTETLAAAALEDALAWRQGRAAFSGTRLEEAAARFARYHGRTIRVEGAARDVAVGGRYELNDLGGFLDLLPASHAVEVTQAANGDIRIQPRAATPPTR